MHGTHRVNSGVAFLWRDNEPAPNLQAWGALYAQRVLMLFISV